MKILDLVLKGKYFDMIASGEKPEEYLEKKKYWTKRIFEIVDDEDAGNYEPISNELAEIMADPGNIELLKDAIATYEVRPRHTHVRFHYGYTGRTMLFELEEITIGKGNADWGAPPYEVLIIKLGKREESE